MCLLGYTQYKLMSKQKERKKFIPMLPILLLNRSCMLNPWKTISKMSSKSYRNINPHKKNSINTHITFKSIKNGLTGLKIQTKKERNNLIFVSSQKKKNIFF